MSEQGEMHMVFSSIPFLYYFLPCVLAVYFLVPAKLKNSVLLLFSLFFYAWGEPVYILLMLFTILIGYIAGILLEKSMLHSFRGLNPKVVLSGAVSLFAAMFIFLKYTDFFIMNINAATGLSVPLLQIVLPIGISFYTFQIISYLVDVYRKEVPAQKNFISLALYVTMFPQLIAGPIVRYSTVSKQLKNRIHSWDMVMDGVTRFIIGLSKKVLLANELGELCDIFRVSSEKSVLYYWLYAAAFMLHIYFDFSGYSDMAIGLGRIFGFVFPENFQYPYISSSITEFWRRWHMSLGTWFRDYVYIPLGGNRVPKIKWYRNILIVWMLTGFWHGASWNFVIWGMYFGVLLVLEKNWLLKILEKQKWLGHVYTIFLLVIGFVVFNASSMRQAINDICCMFGGTDLPFFTKESGYYLSSYGITLLMAGVGTTPIVAKVTGRLFEKQFWLMEWVKPVLLIFLLLLSTAYLVDGSFNPFLYFRF